MGDESSFSFSDTYTSFYTLKKLQTAQAERIRVMWDEQQKDGTFTRFWGVITNVDETQGTSGPRAIKRYSFSMIVEEIALLEKDGDLMTDIFPLGGVASERDFT